MPYEYLDDLSTADVGFRAWHERLEGLLVAASEATMNTMVEDLETIRPLELRRFEFEDDDLELLVHELLERLVFFKDSELLLLRVTDLELDRAAGRYRLRALGRGERLDPTRHETRVDVKAVTLHRFSVERTEEGWQAFVVLDV